MSLKKCIKIIATEFLARRCGAYVISLIPLLIELFRNAATISSTSTPMMILNDYFLSGRLLFTATTILIATSLNFFIDWKDFKSIESKTIRVLVGVMMTVIAICSLTALVMYVTITSIPQADRVLAVVRFVTVATTVVALVISTTVSCIFKINKLINDNQN